MKKFYITTAIDYPSSDPHLGHAYEKVCADVIARWHRLLGEEVFFLTGTDEHGKKIQQAAEKKGMKPKEFVDYQSKAFIELCKKLNISNDRFIRTTEKEHEKICQQIFKKVYDKGDIYLGKYEGHYCTDCETFYTEKELANGNCPTHGKKCELLKEESYFFKMGKYEKKLRQYFEKDATVLPEHRKKEILNRMEQGLQDLSASRANLEWGIPLPINPKHSIYVWFDALLNYISGIDYPSAKFKKFWPADVHLIGKDILWHHTVIWWSILTAADIELPKTVFVHGFIKTAGGEKMSKSLGNVIDPIKLADRYGADNLRYYLTREIPFGEDGHFSEELLCKHINNELANDLGNLLQRTLTMIERYCNGKIPAKYIDLGFAQKNEIEIEKINKHMEKYELHLALQQIMSIVNAANAYVNEKEPWKLKGKELEDVLYVLADSLRIISILLASFMPETSERINKQLGIKEGDLTGCKFSLLKAGTLIGKTEILFQKVEYKAEETKKEINFSISEEAKKIGIKSRYAILTNLEIKSKNNQLEKFKEEFEKKAKEKNFENNEIVEAYKVQRTAEFKNELTPAERLLGMIKKAGKLPTINSFVDAYNVVSVDSGLTIRAHDLDKLKGDLEFVILKEDKEFIPMGAKEKAVAKKGEYAIIDSLGNVLCRMDVRQDDESKITKNTKNAVLEVQGNSKTGDKLLEEKMKEACDLIVKYCGGNYILI
ncbi:MAG: methionine--tRNA ligase [Candidatus Diapherotrites archaeon CG08_land_8_20_14_0_20_34_12]|nr:MAG: methionine--tRNA ligase [Candidatus Diapherotrites archaeon CG08_land_8_20_14_0_20_34_12]